jgi:hypothetical protein
MFSFVIHTNHCHIGDVRVGKEFAFKFRRWDLETFDFDEFFETIGDEEVSGRGLIAYVSCFELQNESLCQSGDSSLS